MSDAIQYVNRKEKALSLYVFTGDQKLQKQILAETSSGVQSWGVAVLRLAPG